MDLCVCGWEGESFEQHFEETKFENDVHIETSPLMEQYRWFLIQDQANHTG